MINYNFIKKAVAISMSSVMMLSIFTGCGAKKTAEDKKNTKPAVSTTVKTTKKSDKKDKTTEDATSDTSTTTSASEKTTARKKGTGKGSSGSTKKQQPAHTPRPTATPTTAAPAPAPTQSSNPYGYHNAWNTVDGMQRDMNSRIAGLGLGFQYYGDNITISDTDGWSSEISNYEVGSSSEWQDKILQDINCINRKKNAVKVFFLTRDNYERQIGNGIYADEAKEGLNSSTFTGPDDEVLAVVAYGSICMG